MFLSCVFKVDRTGTCDDVWNGLEMTVDVVADWLDPMSRLGRPGTSSSSVSSLSTGNCTLYNVKPHSVLSD